MAEDVAFAFFRDVAERCAQVVRHGIAEGFQLAQQERARGRDDGVAGKLDEDDPRRSADLRINALRVD